MSNDSCRTGRQTDTHVIFHTHTMICVPSLWCGSYIWHPFKYKRTWNTTLSFKKSKKCFSIIDIQTQKELYLSVQQTNRVTRAAHSQHTTIIQRSGNHKGAVFPLKKSKLIRVQSSRQGNFLAPPKPLRDTAITAPVGEFNPLPKSH